MCASPPESPDDAAAAADAAKAVALALRGAGHEAWFVGGCVRDRLLGTAPVDWDIATSARPEEVRALFEHTVPVGEAFGVMLVVECGRNFEVATFRTESGYDDGRRPSDVAFATAEEDVRRRDFTVNGLLMDPETGEVRDLVGGRADLEARVIRTIGDPDERFGEDHLRALRAVRFACGLGFEIEPGTLAAVARAAPSIQRISAERIREELTKILTRRGARRGFELLAGTGLLAEVLPEVDLMRGCSQPPQFHPEGDVWEHTLSMLDMMPPSPDPRLAWGVLMHDVGKPPMRTEDADGIHFNGHAREGERIAEEIMARLRFARAEIDTVTALVHHHMRFMHVQEMRPNRLKRFLRIDDFDLHLELHRLDCASSHGKLDNHEFCLAKLAELGEEELRPTPLLGGRDLIAMGFEPGPAFTEILRAVEDAQLDGRISTSEEAKALVLARWGSGPRS